jgi:8-amino-7-oxononanoate synthase
MNLAERWSSQLESLRAAGRYRSVAVPRGADFSSNDYLGYGKEPFPATACKLPRGAAASRLLRGHQPIWDEVESALACWHRAEGALVFNSGYAANEGLLSTLLEPDDFLASDEFNHASIIDGGRLAKARRFIYRHNDLGHLEEGLRAATKDRSPGRQLFIVTESLFGMEGDRSPLLELAALARRYDANLIVDEAHATGCFGPEGAGLVDALGLREQVLATVHTCGKALGLAGAYVCGSSMLKEILVNRCRHFIYTTAPPPIVGWWYLQALDRVRGDDATRQKLHDNAQFFRAELARTGTEVRGEDYIVPVILGDDKRAVAAAEHLQEAGFDVRAIRPPTVPPGTSRLRISIHADHDPGLIRAAAAAVAEVVDHLASGVP